MYKKVGFHSPISLVATFVFFLMFSCYRPDPTLDSLPLSRRLFGHYSVHPVAAEEGREGMITAFAPETDQIDPGYSALDNPVFHD